MATYIPKEAALKVVEKYGTTNGFTLGRSFALGRHTGLAICIASEIAEIPAADVAPVVHGRWVPFHSSHAGEIQYCSVCDIGCTWKPDYCPNCGAMMDGEP